MIFICVLASLLFISLTVASPEPLPYQSWAGKRVLFVYAHIDDMEASAGGLVSLISSQSEVSIAILTNGDKGCGNDALCGNTSNAELATMRQGEQYVSASLLGIEPEHIHFLDYEDCILSSYSATSIQQQITSLIRSIQPHIVITWDPTPYFDMIPSEGWGDMGYHPDHQLSGKITLDSIWSSHLSRLWPELGAAWKVEELYFWTFAPSKTPSFCVDVTGLPYQAKTAAFLAMKTQYTNPKDMTTFLDFMGRAAGTACGLDDVAEAFTYVLW